MSEIELWSLIVAVLFLDVLMIGLGFFVGKAFAESQAMTVKLEEVTRKRVEEP